MRVDKGTLLVRDGNTHFPAPINEFRYFRGQLDIPTQIILVDGSGNITLDALDWLAEQQAHVIRLRWNGEISILSTPTGFSGKIENIKWQLEARENREMQIEFAQDRISRKLRAALWNLQNVLPDSPYRAAAIENHKSAIADIRSISAQSEFQMLGYEGGLASGYFNSWRSLPLKWSASKRFPIPNEWREYRSRSRVGGKHRNRDATHPVNAMLNYAYKVLETQIRIQCVIEGYDPTIGVLHTGKRTKKTGQPSFVLDLMEPYRPIIDREIIELLSDETLSGADFSIQNDGVCRLNPEMARYVAQKILTSEGSIAVTVSN